MKLHVKLFAVHTAHSWCSLDSVRLKKVQTRSESLLYFLVH